MKKVWKALAFLCMLSSLSIHATAQEVERRNNFIFEAFSRGRVTVARIVLLIQKNLFAAINTDLSGNTLLQLAALREDVALAIDLLNNGFDYTATNNAGKTALDIFNELVDNTMLGDETVLNTRIANLEAFEAAIAALTP